MNARLPLPVDSRRTHLADAMHTQRLALAVICTGGLLLNVLLAAILLKS